MSGFFKLAVAVAAGSMLVGGAQAALVGAVKPSEAVSYDTKITLPTLIYDHDFYGTEGRLMLLAAGSTLSGAGVPTGGAQPGQTYLGSGDSLRDLVLDVRVSNTGAFVSGSVYIPRSNDFSTNDSWTYQGALTSFGFSSDQMDAKWNVASYDFSDVAANTGLLNAPASCSLGGSGCGLLNVQGGLIILAQTSLIPQTAGAINFGVDWIVAPGATTPGVRGQMGTFDDGLSTPTVISASPAVDIWMQPAAAVPEPEQYALAAAGLAVLALYRRRPNLR